MEYYQPPDPDLGPRLAQAVGKYGWRKTGLFFLIIAVLLLPAFVIPTTVLCAVYIVGWLVACIKVRDWLTGE